MPFERLSNHFVISKYENIRDQLTSATCPIGEPVRERANELRREIECCGLQHKPIDWANGACS
jgi:hypothetical protein